VSGEAARAPARHTGPDHAIELDRLLDALEPLRAAILDHEQARYEVVDGGGHDDRVGRRNALHARGDVGGVAEHIDLRAAAPGDDHGAGMDADAGRERDVVLAREAIVQRRHHLEDRQSAAHGAFGGVLERVGIAEVYQ
jgi:hypothetical protein